MEERKNILKSVCELFEVEGIDKEKILAALADERFSDFEDCLQMECAIRAMEKWKGQWQKRLP